MHNWLGKLNDPLEMWQDFEPENFQEKLGIKISKNNLPTKTGFSEIQVSGLTKETNYFYQEFYDDYAKEIGQKFKLDSTQEIWSTFRADTFNFVGTIEVSGNAILLRNEEAEICHILPVEKYKVVAKAEMGCAEVWAYQLK
jgi:hypothetical protein